MCRDLKDMLHDLFCGSKKEQSRALAEKYDLIPDRLYKFRTFDENDYNLENLFNDHIWLASPRNFNDPFDSRIAIDLSFMYRKIPPSYLRTVKEKLSDLFSDSELDSFLSNPNPFLLMAKDIEQKMLARGTITDMEVGKFSDCIVQLLSEIGENENESYRSLVRDGLKICCFSSCCRNVLMWSHYAKDHEGFCVEYDFKSLGSSSITCNMLYPVIYTDIYQDRTDEIFKSSDTISNIFIDTETALIKSVDWKYEQEWRLIFGNAIIENECNYQVPTATRVIAGIKISDEHLSKLERICQSKNIPFVRARQSDTSYEIIV